MKKSLFSIIWLAILVFATSCSSMYIPSMGNAPLLSEKGEGLAELSLTTNAVQLEGDYAITDHLAAMADFTISYGNFTNKYDIYTSKNEDSSALADLNNYGKFNNRHYELGVGYYNITNTEIFKMEAFGGVGFSHATDDKDYGSSIQTYNSKYVMAFGQLNLGVTSDYVDFGLAVRVAPTFHSLEWTYENPNDATYNREGTESFTLWHVEPLLFLRAGYKQIRFSAKAGLSFPYQTDSYQTACDNIDNTAYTKTTVMHFSIGVCYEFGRNKN